MAAGMLNISGAGEGSVPCAPCPAFLRAGGPAEQRLWSGWEGRHEQGEEVEEQEKEGQQCRSLTTICWAPVIWRSEEDKQEEEQAQQREPGAGSLDSGAMILFASREQEQQEQQPSRRASASPARRRVALRLDRGHPESKGEDHSQGSDLACPRMVLGWSWTPGLLGSWEQIDKIVRYAAALVEGKRFGEVRQAAMALGTPRAGFPGGGHKKATLPIQLMRLQLHLRCIDTTNADCRDASPMIQARSLSCATLTEAILVIVAPRQGLLPAKTPEASVPSRYPGGGVAESPSQDPQYAKLAVEWSNFIPVSFIQNSVSRASQASSLSSNHQPRRGKVTAAGCLMTWGERQRCDND
ncbi:hypothetical protein CMUS01_01060 [Colletotrichum musicola]|uniref:Uncharacterized protein n=1 Tax=Colletotrichum musicola TaxID=2175873 RepID=A0A8H6U926_9PEZI|nr:hypothetical protein CMUS01_01060 [Colletotrichum musicola]